MLTKKDLYSHNMDVFYSRLGDKVAKDIKQFKETLGKIDIEYKSSPNSVVRSTDFGKESEGIVTIAISEESQLSRYKAYAIDGLEGLGIELYLGVKNYNLEEEKDKSNGFVKFSYLDGDVSVMEVLNGSYEELVSPRMQEIYSDLGNKITSEISKFDDLRNINVKYRISEDASISLTSDGINEEGTVLIPNSNQYARYKASTVYGIPGIEFKLELISEDKEHKTPAGLVTFSYDKGNVAVWEAEDEASLKEEPEQITGVQK